MGLGNSTSLVSICGEINARLLSSVSLYAVCDCFECTGYIKGDFCPVFLFMLFVIVFDKVCTGDTSKSYCPLFISVYAVFNCF